MPDQDAFPIDNLPVELLSRVFSFVNRPFDFDTHIRGTKTGRQDLKAIRLVSRKWNDIAASLLFETLYISTCFDQLAVVRSVANAPHLAKGVKTLFYDFLGFDPRCGSWGWDEEAWYCWHVESCPDCTTCLLVGDGYDDQPEHYDLKKLEKHSEECQEEHIGGHLKLYKQLYEDEQQILTQALDHDCLVNVLPKFPALRSIHFESFPWIRWSTNQDDPPVPKFPALRPVGYHRDGFRALCNMLEALKDASRPIREIGLPYASYELLDLSDEALSHVCRLFSRLTAFDLAFDQPPIDYMTRGPLGYPLMPRGREKFQNGALSRIVSSLKNVERLRIRLFPGVGYNGEKSVHAGLPLYTFLGTSTFLRLRILTLDSFDVRSGELMEFLQRHGRIEELFLEHLLLVQGQWSHISDQIDDMLPDWKRICHKNLKQVEPPVFHEGFNFFLTGVSGSCSR